MRQIELPSGRKIWGVSKRDALLIYDDIFRSDCYRRGGIVINPGDVVVDAGANIGLFEIFLDVITKGLRVFAFEPVLELCDALQRNVKQCRRIDVEVIQAGLAYSSGERDINYYPHIPSASSMRPETLPKTRARDHLYIRSQMPRWLGTVIPSFVVEAIRRWHLRPTRLRCRVTPLPEFLQSRCIDRVDLLKVDVEGCEWEIIDSMGAAPDGNWAKIRQIIVEVHDPESVIRMAAVLISVGFRVEVLPNPAIPSMSICYGVRA